MASTAERRRRSNGSAKTQEWVNVKSAAEEAGISVSTLRSWYRKGLIESKDSTENGRHKMVRLPEVLERAKGVKASQASAEGSPPKANTAPEPVVEAGAGEPPPEQVPPDGDAQAETAEDVDLVHIAKALPELARELADARERAGRAEAKLEFVSEQLADLRAAPRQDEQKIVALQNENLALHRRTQQLEGRLQAMAQGQPVDDDYPEMSPEEEDQFLSLTQRRKARRKRKRAARKEARAARG